MIEIIFLNGTSRVQRDLSQRFLRRLA